MNKLMSNDAFKNQVPFALCDGLSALVIGATMGYPSSALVSMMKDKDFHLTEEQGNWIGSIIPAMALVGSIASKLILDAIGRKRSLILSSLASCLVWLIIGYATTIYQLLFARLIAGFFVGLQQVAVAVFMAETVHPKLRPVFGILPGVAANLGFMIVTAIPESVANWRGLAFLGASLSIPLIILTASITESPYYLLKTGNKISALKILTKLRDTPEEAENEFKGLVQNALKSTSKLDLSNMFKPPNRWPITMAMLLHFFQPLTGCIVMSIFMGLIYEHSDSFVQSNVGAAIMTTINIGSVIFMAKLPTMFGRRKLIKWSSMIIIGSQVLLALYLMMRENNSPFYRFFSLIPMVSFIGLGIGFSLAWGPIPWAFIGDGVPLSVRSDAAALITTVNWALNFVVSKSFSLGVFYLGYPKLLGFYSMCTLVGMVVMQVHLPETFGLNAAQLDQYYEQAYSKKNQ